MTLYKAAVIIPTRGGAAKLHFPLDALEQQTEKDFQVIVVCDGDIDGSAQVVQQYKERGVLNIEAIVFEENQGRSKALNAGHQAADAHVLIRCDDDLEPSPDYIEKHISHHQKCNSEVGVIGLYLNNYPETPYARAYGRYRDKKFREDAYQSTDQDSWMFWAGNVSLTREIFNKIGGYDERYRLYGWEDVDFGYLMHKTGVKVLIDPELATKHHIAATTTASRATRALHSGAARSLFVEKHGTDVLKNLDPAGIWGTAVKSVAKLATEKNIEIAGNTIDKIADNLPHKISEKLISLLVEASAYAGIRYPSRARKVF
ncbi:glycosyltransferase family 2 protein [Rothia amarae]|uniref:Glycosyltransferase family 2 protein n=2 Tax=Rothia amarae TaxID=169480 RepID=A0A7H2BN07_9MICC|nr:glycosyltransferase family 2 protein [Rothia amarae]SIK52548.1 glycosyl transferase family protein [Mycobacteroides abscessus subsp. abscessus]